jgi:hypothetical protein
VTAEERRCDREPSTDHESSTGRESVNAERRPLIERIGLAAIAAVLATLFGGVAVAAWVGGEVFLAAMGGIGCLMTAWVGALTLFRS